MNKLNWWTSLNISTEQHTRPNKVSVSLWCTCTRAHTVSVLILLLITYKWPCSPKPTTEPWPYHKIQAQQKHWCHSQIIFDSVQLHRRQPIRLPHPWDSPGKNTGVGCHFLLQCMKVKSESEVPQLYPTFRDPIHGLQPTRLLHPWDFPVKSSGVGCHCLLQSLY